MATTKEFTFDFSRVDGGINSNDDPLSLSYNQVGDGTLNAMLLTDGAKRRPAGKKYYDTFSNLCLGLFSYLKEDGTEKLIAIEKIFIDGPETATYARIKNLTDNTTLYEDTTLRANYNYNFLTYKNKCWVVNGDTTYKIEGTSVYKVGISPPLNATATAASSGSLPDGVYKIFVVFYRDVSGVKVLYSEGQELTNVTLGTGNNKISFTVTTLPDDSQISGAAVFMTDAGGSTYYYYGAKAGTGALSWTISDATAKNEAIEYNTYCLPNGIPPGARYHCFLDGRMWLANSDGYKSRLWYSKRIGNVYDLERFPSENYKDFESEILSIFPFKENLYISTSNGLYRLPYGDPSAVVELVDSRWWFKYHGTIQQWGSYVIGLTNDGVRLFDGSNFSEKDYSSQVKDKIARIYDNTDAMHEPSGIIYRRPERTEYNLFYMDNTISSNSNNRRLILNLDTIGIDSSTGQFITCWEEWNLSGEFATINKSNVLYVAQSLNETVKQSVVYTEGAGADDRVWVDNKYKATTSTYLWKIVTRVQQNGLQYFNRYDQLRFFLRTIGGVTIKVQSADRFGKSYTLGTVDPIGGALIFPIIMGKSVFTNESKEIFSRDLPAYLKGYAVQITIEQADADDPNVYLYGMVLSGLAYSGRLF